MTRRKLLKNLGTSLALSAAAISPHEGRAARLTGGNEVKPYDLLIRGGKVVDPSQNLETERDVAITGGKIARVEADIPAAQAREVVSAGGKIVTPGLIDLHTHVFPYVGPYGIEPDSNQQSKTCSVRR